MRRFVVDVGFAKKIREGEDRRPSRSVCRALLKGEAHPAGEADEAEIVVDLELPGAVCRHLPGVFDHQVVHDALAEGVDLFRLAPRREVEVDRDRHVRFLAGLLVFVLEKADRRFVRRKGDVCLVDRNRGDPAVEGEDRLEVLALNTVFIDQIDELLDHFVCLHMISARFVFRASPFFLFEKFLFVSSPTETVVCEAD